MARRPMAWPTDVHITVPEASGGRSRHGIVRHTAGPPPVAVLRDGLLVAPVTDTAVEMARFLPFPDAVAMIDRAIHIPRRGGSLATRGDLERSLEALAGPARVKGRGAALRAAEFASTQSGSGGESISRAHIFLLGFAAPELQVRFDDDAGFIAFVDFFWRTINKVGEFDGLGKYLKEEYARGLSTAQVVIAEKDREDRVRAVGRTHVCTVGLGHRPRPDRIRPVPRQPRHSPRPVADVAATALANKRMPVPRPPPAQAVNGRAPFG